MSYSLSSQLIQFALEQNVGVLCVEQLHGIGKREVKHSRDKRDLNQWSYYRLIDNLRYKARREGLRVVFVNPRNTIETMSAIWQTQQPGQTFLSLCLRFSLSSGSCRRDEYCSCA